MRSAVHCLTCRIAWLGAVCSLVLLAAGCPNPGPVTGKISGTVQLDGQPLRRGQVIFQDAEGGRVAGQVVDGKYFILQAKPGPVKVAVDTTPPAQLRGMARGKKARDQPPPAGKEGDEKAAMARHMAEEIALYVTLPSKYADPEKSGLSHTVTVGDQTYDIALVSADP